MTIEEAVEKARRERERQLYGAGVSQLAVIEREYGYVGIYAYPSLDAVVASSILSALLQRKGIRSWILVNPLPPAVIEEPSILVGFEASLAVSAEFRAPSIVIARGEKPQGLTRAAVVASRDASLSTLAAGMLSEVLVVGDVGVVAVSMGYWLGLDRDKEGDFIGPDRWLAELLDAENRTERMLTIKLFDWFEKSVEDAIASTLDPFYPGLTGDREAVVKMLEGDEEARKALGVRVTEAPESAVTRIAEMLYEHLRSSSRSQRRVTEVVGWTRYTRRLPVGDLRRIPAVIAAWLESRGVLATIPLASALDIVLRLADVVYQQSFEATVASIERLVKSKTLLDIREYGPIRLCVHRGVEEGAVYPIVAKQLKLLGVYPGDCLAAVDTGTAIHALLDTTPGDPRHEKLREAFRRGCLRYIDDTLYAEARPC